MGYSGRRCVGGLPLKTTGNPWNRRTSGEDFCFSCFEIPNFYLSLQGFVCFGKCIDNDQLIISRNFIVIN